MPKKNDKYFNTVNSLDILLSDILAQIKIITQDEKDTPYTKLIELFFKGVDLREKIINPKKTDVSDPQVNVIKGIDQELI